MEHPFSPYSNWHSIVAESTHGVQNPIKTSTIHSPSVGRCCALPTPVRQHWHTFRERRSLAIQHLSTACPNTPGLPAAVAIKPPQACKRGLQHALLACQSKAHSGIMQLPITTAGYSLAAQERRSPHLLPLPIRAIYSKQSQNTAPYKRPKQRLPPP